MAEEYTIWLRNGTKKKEKAIAGTTGDNQKDNSPNAGNLAGGSGGGVSKAAAATYIAYKQYIAPFVKQAISYQISTVSLKTGRVEHQQRLQFAYDAGSKVVQLVENIAIGAAVGGLPGAIIGATVSVVQTAVQYAQAKHTLDLERSAESISIGLQNVRAGGSVASYNSSRSDRR